MARYSYNAIPSISKIVDGIFHEQRRSIGGPAYYLDNSETSRAAHDTLDVVEIVDNEARLPTERIIAWALRSNAKAIVDKLNG